MTARKKKVCWLFPTNTNNLCMILAQGLLSSVEGFSKYYQDVLLDYNGYLPLFKHKVSAASLEKAVSEADHLVPCLLEIDLSKLSGQVNMLSKGKVKVIDLSSDLLPSEENIEQLLIPLPLPLGCISKVIFKTKDDIEAFKKDAEIRSNVVLNKIKLSSTVAESKLFKTTDADTLLVLNNTDSKIETPTIKPSYSDIYAYGGMISLLFYYAKNGALSQHFLDDFSQNQIPQADTPKERAIPQFIHEYFHDDIDESRPENKILKGIVSSCIGSTDFKNSVINFLRNSDWDDEKVGKRSYELADKLDDYYVSNSSRSTSEWFDSVKSDIEKILLMLFTREDSDSLIDFHNPKIKFTEREYLLFALFFGIRDGFIKVPAFIREYNNLQEYISYKMAVYAHQKMSSNLAFKEIKPPKTVWQFVVKKLSKANTKLLNLEPCVQTIMPKSDFKHEKGINIYAGFHEAKYKIIDKDYFQIISTKKVTNTIYNKLK